MTGELARQIDASKTTLGDVADLGHTTVLEFTVQGAKGSFMAKHIPDGIKVTIPGYLVILGLAGAILAVIAAMVVAKTAKDWINARRQLNRVVGPALTLGSGVEGVTEVLEERAEEKGTRLALDFREWHIAQTAWLKEFREDNDRDPTDSEFEEWLVLNPLPEA